MSESNNYARTVWATGDLITADKMNNSEKQIDNVTNALNIGNGYQCLYLTPGYSYRTINNVVEENMYKSATFNDGGTAKVACQEGDIFIINGTGASTSRLWVFTDFAGTVLRTAPSNNTASNLILKAPKNSAYLYVNSTTNMLSFKGLTPYVSDELLKTSAQSASLVPLDFLPDGVSLIQTTKFGYINPRTNPIDLNPTSSEVMEHAVVECVPGEQFYLNVRGAASGRAYAFADSNLAPITDTIAASDTEYHGILTAPENAAYLIINNRLDPDSVFFHSYKGAIEDATSKFGMWNGYFRQCININTVDKQIEIPAQRIFIGNKQVDVPETQLQYDYSKVYINLYYDRLSKEFKILNSKNDTPPLGYYFIGAWRKGQEEHAAINGSFTVNGKENYEDIIDNKISDFNDSLTANMILPGQEDMGWIGNWIRPEVVSFKGVRDKIYWAFTAKSGAKGIAEYDFDSGRIIKRNLHKLRTRDLHNDLAIHIFDDGIILCAYSTGHNTDKNVRIRKSLYPENIEYFTDELVLPCEGATTYAQLVESSDKLYLFYRNSVLKWAYRYSTDRGDTWSDEVSLIVSDAQYYCVFEKTTNADVLRVIMYTNPQLPELLDTNFRQAFFHTDTNTLYNSDNTTVLGQSDVDKNNITILVPNDANLPNQRLLDVAISDIDKPLLVYAPFTPPASGGIYRIFDSGVTHDIVACGAVLLSNTPYYLGAKFIDTTQMIIFHGSGAEGGIDIGTIYNYDGTNVTSVKDIYREHRGSENIRNFYPIIDANKKVIMWLRGVYGSNYREFQTDAMIYSIDEDRIIPKSNIDGVKYDSAQDLTATQKQTARTNISAASEEDVTELENNLNIDITDLRNDLNTDIADLKSALDDMQEVTGLDTDLLPKITTAGAIKISDGTPYASGSSILNYFKYSPDFIAVNQGDKLTYALRSPANYAIIAFYTSASESGFSASNSVEGNGGVLSGTYTVPADGYIRLTTRNETAGKTATLRSDGEIDTVKSNISTLQTDVGILQTSLSSAETEITAHSADIDGVAKRTFSLITYATRSGYIKNNGAFAPHANYRSTDYIPINNGDSFVYNIAHGSTLPIISFFSSASESSYDVTKSIIGSTDYASGTYTASADGYIVLTYLKVKTDSSVIFYQNIPDNVQVKINAITPDTSHRIKVAIFGDSIFGNDGEIVDYLNQYDDFTDVYNCAFGGTSVSNRVDTTSPYYWFDGVSLWTAITSGTTTNQDANISSLSNASQAHWATIKSLDFSAIDLIVLAYGTNDYTQGKSISDITTAYNTVIDMIREEYPAIRILVLSPIWRLISYDSVTSSYVDSDTKTYAAGVTLRQIADGIIADCKTKRVSVFDGYSNVEVCIENVPTFFDNVTQVGDQDQQTGIEVPHGSGQYYSGVHLNATGNLMYAQIIHGLISTLF